MNAQGFDKLLPNFQLLHNLKSEFLNSSIGTIVTLFWWSPVKLADNYTFRISTYADLIVFSIFACFENNVVREESYNRALWHYTFKNF